MQAAALAAAGISEVEKPRRVRRKVTRSRDVTVLRFAQAAGVAGACAVIEQMVCAEVWRVAHAALLRTSVDLGRTLLVF